MRVDIICLLFVGCFIRAINSEEKDKNDKGTTAGAQSQVPQTTQALVNKQEPEKSASVEKAENPNEETPKNEKEKEEIVVHNHGDKYYFGPSDRKEERTPKDTYDFDKEYNDDSFDKYLKDYRANLDKPVDDGFKSSKTVHTEHFEVKELNPEATSPDEKYIIRGSYKVRESDPFDSKRKKTHLHTYDSPHSKIAASIYSKFDYLNFPYNNDDKEDYQDGEKESEEEEKEPSSSDGHENIEDYVGNAFASLERDDDYKEDVDDYADSQDEEKKESRDKEESKQADYFYSPYDDIDSTYDKEWQKYIIQLVYGDDAAITHEHDR